MLGNKSTTSNRFLIKECDLDDSSYEKFIDSGEDEKDNDNYNYNGILVLSDKVTQPTLESLLNNLSLDKPIIPSSTTTAITSSSSSCTPPSSSTYNREPVIRQNNSISWLSTAFQYEETSEDNLVIDGGSTEVKSIILYATKMKLIEKLTSILGK